MGCTSTKRSQYEQIIKDYFDCLPIKNTNQLDFARTLSESRKREEFQDDQAFFYQVIFKQFLSLEKDHEFYTQNLFFWDDAFKIYKKQFKFFVWSLLLLCKHDKSTLKESCITLLTPWKESENSLFGEDNCISFLLVNPWISIYINLISRIGIDIFSYKVGEDNMNDFRTKLNRYYSSKNCEKYIENYLHPLLDKLNQINFDAWTNKFYINLEDWKVRDELARMYIQCESKT